MPVNPIQRVPQYQIDSTSEATDDERRREERRSRNKESKKGATPSVKNVAAAQPEANVTDTTLPSDLLSQIVDGEKVIELLSHRPKESTVKHQTFKRLAKTTKSSDDATAKKINKAF